MASCKIALPRKHMHAEAKSSKKSLLRAVENNPDFKMKGKKGK